ncbi:MAG: orotate phosphoribosyltransferase, partial [Mycoplasmoidaceae bacterium]|nr:orotate phosphoribosyltransferase [Mycoplasmoidaceae bacterium]
MKSPIYCDNRLIISYPESRELVENQMVEMIKEFYPEAQYIVGTSTAGIPHAAIIATKMNKPMAYVRSKVKDHGRAKHIEGYIPENAKVVVIEDLMSTGGSSIEVVNILKSYNINVLGIASIFTYNLNVCKDNLQKAN